MNQAKDTADMLWCCMVLLAALSLLHWVTKIPMLDLVAVAMALLGVALLIAEAASYRSRGR